MAKRKKSPTEAWLEEPTTEERKTRCMVCSDDLLRTEVSIFYEAKSSGATSRSWRSYYDGVLIKHFGWAGSLAALRNHIYNHLKNPRHG